MPSRGAPVPGLRRHRKKCHLFGRHRMRVYGLAPGLYTAKKLRDQYDDMAVVLKSRRAAAKVATVRLIAESTALEP